MQNYKKKFNKNAVEVKFFLGYAVTRLHGYTVTRLEG